MLPKVTCICTAHNKEAFVGAAIDSILAQDYPADRLEIIVVNDGSTDGTVGVLERYGDRITVVDRENGGVNAATHTGLAHATGDYIAELGGDDEWSPGRVMRQVTHLQAHPHVGLVFGDLEVVDTAGATLHPSFWALEGIQVRRGDVLSHLARSNFVSGGAAMFRAAFLPQLEPFPTAVRAREDWWIALRVAEQAEIDYLETAVTRYRLHGANQCFQATGARLARNQREEIAMRRWVLRHLAHGRAGVADLLSCYAGLEGAAVAAGIAAGDGPLSGIGVTPDDMRRAEELRAEAAAAEPETAARLLVEALGHDPWNGRARIEAHAHASHLAHRGELPGTARGLPDSRMALDGLRSFVAVTFADMLDAQPELAAAYAASYGPDADATLVVCAPGRTEEAAAANVLSLFARAGIDEASCPDVLIVPDELVASALRQLAGRADAVLTTEEPPPLLRALPRLGLAA